MDLRLGRPSKRRASNVIEDVDDDMDTASSQGNLMSVSGSQGNPMSVSGASLLSRQSSTERMPSLVWQFFSRLDRKTLNKKAGCNLCGKVVK